MTTSGPFDEVIPPTADVAAEAQSLCADILKDIELSQIPLAVAALKAMRLSRLTNDFEHQQIFEWESGGYPRGQSGVSRDVWRVGVQAGRTFYKWDRDSETNKQYMYRESIEQLERLIEMGTIGVRAAQDPSASVGSTNLNQPAYPLIGNVVERRTVRNAALEASMKLAARRTFIYQYAMRKYYELKFAGVADDVFQRIRSSSDPKIGLIVPGAVRKFTAVYDNLKSQNPEDWANAVHSCRRILQDLADAVFPPQSEGRTRAVNGEHAPIKLGAEQYINRLMAFVDDSTESKRFQEIVGSHLRYMGERLDALFGAAQKGSHATVTKEEADRCVIYTYLLVSDILSLHPQQTPSTRFTEVDEAPFETLEGPQEQLLDEHFAESTTPNPR